MILATHLILLTSEAAQVRYKNECALYIYSRLTISLLATDINECEVENGGCQDNCANTVGSFNCSCDAGRLLDEDLKSCISKYCHT